jgi:microcystin-dependent protein
MRKSITILVLLLCLSFSNTANAQEPFIGEIKMFGGNFAPRGFAFCDGQLLSISQNTALFAILGTTYGGDGRTTFGLPDLRGRVPVHAGTGPGLSSYRIGQKGGTETTTITVANLPAHSHPYAAPAVSEDGNTSVPTGAVPGGTKV